MGATLNVMALLLVNMIGYAVGIRGAGHVAGGIFLDKEGLLAVAYGFVFFFSGVQASACAHFKCSVDMVRQGAVVVVLPALLQDWS